LIHELVALPGSGPEYSDLPSSRAYQRAAEVPARNGSPSTAAQQLTYDSENDLGRAAGMRSEAAWVTSAAERLTHRNLFFLPMRGSVDDRSVGARIVPGHRGVPARRRTGMNPARLLMPTSPARIAPSPGPRQIHTRQIKTHMTTEITQTRLVTACSPLVV